MPPSAITFRLGSRLQSGRGRAVGFLEGHGELDAGAAFEEFETATERAMRSNMEHWVAGNNAPTTRFHGFPNDADHSHCFVFKHHEHRLYGFLCHPSPNSRPGFQLCALCIYAEKRRKYTDKAELDRAEGWLRTRSAIVAINHLYPEYQGEGV